jgi:quercetin dioxygenase-like cupin family protein
MKFLVLALALTILPAASVLAQDAPPARAPGAPLLENEQIRVREVRFAPGARQPATARPNTFFYALTDGSLVFTPPGRKEYELTFKAGEALWLPSQETATANEGDKEVRALIVEVKARAPAGKAAKKGAKGKKGGKKAAAKH